MFHRTEAELEAEAQRIVDGLPLMIQRLDTESVRLGVAIAMTPTGAKRDKLTEANIHLHYAMKAIKDATT